MSWLRIEGRMPHHRKVAPLSDAAFRLHITAQAWCVEEETDGLIPSKVPGTLQAAPRGKALAKVVAELEEAGLWDPTADGYAIHDFLDYNPTAAECAAARAAKVAAGQAGGKRSAEVRASKKQAPAQAPASTNAQANGKHLLKQNPSPTPTPTPTPEAAAPKPPAAAAAAAAAAPDPRIPCPPDLDLTADQRGTLESGLIPGWAVDSVRLGFVTSERGDLGKTMTLTQWRKCLSQAVTRTWNDPRRRPKPPEPSEIRAVGPDAADRAFAAAELAL